MNLIWKPMAFTIGSLSSIITISEQLLDAVLTSNRKRWKEITGKEIYLSFFDKSKQISNKVIEKK